MARAGIVLFNGVVAGFIVEDADGYQFAYDELYLHRSESVPLSAALPLRREPFFSRTMIPFFDGLIPEGRSLENAVHTWKLDPQDRMGLLLVCCKESEGPVSIIPLPQPL